MLISKDARPNVFISDILCVVADLVNEDSQDIVHMQVAKEANEEQLLQIVIHVKGDCKPIYDNEYFSEEDSFELVQQKTYIDALLNRGQV